MIELIQVPYSPYCIVQRRILEFSGTPFKIVNIPNGDRSLIWKLSRERYYAVPLVRDGKNILFETCDDSQVISKYLDSKLDLGLFPREHEGIQDLLWRDLENHVESYTFKLNDIYHREFVPKNDLLRFTRHKERKFGRGCLDQWKRDQKKLLAGLDEALLPYEHMLGTRPFLLDDARRFVDFDLYGMLGNFLYSGHYKLPARHKALGAWFKRIASVKRHQLT